MFTPVHNRINTQGPRMKIAWYAPKVYKWHCWMLDWKQSKPNQGYRISASWYQLLPTLLYMSSTRSIVVFQPSLLRLVVSNASLSSSILWYLFRFIGISGFFSRKPSFSNANRLIFFSEFYCITQVNIIVFFISWFPIDEHSYFWHSWTLRFPCPFNSTLTDDQSLPESYMT